MCLSNLPAAWCAAYARARACRDRISSSLTLYELGRRFWQHQDYERSLVAVEQAISLKLFPYKDSIQLERWQRGLLSPGYMFKRPKLELADALILKANCMYELGRRGRSMEYLYQALEAVHLAAAFMHCSMVSDGGQGGGVPRRALAGQGRLASSIGASARGVLGRPMRCCLLEQHSCSAAAMALVGARPQCGGGGPHAGL